MHLPGIPPQGSQDSTIFWISFWANIYSAILSGVLSSAIFAIIVWQLQIQSEKRIEKRQFKNEFSKLRKELRRISNKEPSISASSLKSAIPSTITKTLNLLTRIPLERWKRVLTNEELLIENIILLQQIYEHYLFSVDEFDLLLAVEIREHNESKNLENYNDSSYKVYIIGRVVGYSHDEVLRWTTLKQKDFEEAYEAVLQHSGVNEKCQSYLITRRNLINHFQEIMKFLNKK